MAEAALTEQLTQRLSALCEPVRLRICRLLEDEELTVGEVATVLQLPASTVSRHLKTLSQASLLSKWSVGNTTWHRLSPENLPESSRALWETVREQMGLQDQLAEDQRRLEAVLDERRVTSEAYFGAIAGTWEQVKAELFGHHFTQWALLGLLPQHWQIVDLGCGTGEAARTLGRFVEQVVGIDRSRAMLEMARKARRQGERVKLIQGELSQTPLQPQQFDAALLLLVLHHLEEPIAVLREAARLLKAGGRVVVVDMFPHDRTSYRTTMGHRHLGFHPDDLCRMLGEVGLEAPRVTPLPSDTEAKGPSLFVATARQPERTS